MLFRGCCALWQVHFVVHNQLLVNRPLTPSRDPNGMRQGPERDLVAVMAPFERSGAVDVYTPADTSVVLCRKRVGLPMCCGCMTAWQESQSEGGASMFNVTRASMFVFAVALLSPLLLSQGSAQAEPEQAPQVGDCTTGSTIDSWTLVGGTVDCGESHTGQTVYVGKWTATVSPTAANKLTGEQETKVAKALSKQFAACDEAAESYLGSRKGSAVRASLFTTNGTGPDADQWAAGERWFRCDIVAVEARTSWKADPTRLLTIPSPGDLRGYLSTPDFDFEYQLCIAENPKTSTYFPFKCGSRQAVGFGVAWATPEGKYPGSTDEAFTQMRKQCLATMRKMSVNVATDRAWILNFSGELTKSNYSKSTWLCGVS